MSAEDYIDFDVMVNEEPEQEMHPWVPPKCKFCGKPNLRWRQARNGKWGLYTEAGTKHICKEFTTGFVKQDFVKQKPIVKAGKTERVK